MGRFDWCWGQDKVGQRSRTAQPCGVLWLSRETQRQGFSSQWPLGSQVCFWEGVMSLDSVLFWQCHSVASVSAAVYCGTLTPWKMKEMMFLTSVNRRESACSERCRTGLAAPLRWALSLELCLFVMSVRKSFEKEPYRHPLIRFSQGDLFFLPSYGLINDFLSATMKSSPLNTI